MTDHNRNIKISFTIFSVIFHHEELELELELFFYLNTVNLSDKIVLKITIYFDLYKHGLKI